MNRITPKHILFLVSSMQGGGAERVAALLCNAWVERGHKVTLMPTFSERGGCSYPLDSKVKLKFLADFVDNSKSRLRRLWALRRYMLESKPDVVVSFLTDVNIAALLASYGTGLPVIISERTYPPKHNTHISDTVKFWRWLSYKWACSIIVQTTEIKNWCGNIWPKINCKVIANPVVLPLPTGSPINSPKNWVKADRKIVLVSGRLIRSKRFDLIIQSFAAIANENPNWNLVILGEGPERSALEMLRNKFGLEQRIHLPGYVGNPGSWYESADIYVLSSAYEGFPNTLLEAMAHGVASVAFDIQTGPKDIMENGKAGILLPNNNHVTRLTEALGILMLDPTQRRTWSEAALSVQERYSLETVLQEWDRIMEAR